MFEFSLLKSLFFELDKYKIEGVTYSTKKQSTYHRLEVQYDTVPEITVITAEERILPYVDRYYFYINDETYPADIKEPAVKQVIYEFYKEYLPSYLKEGLPDDMTDVNILECFNVFQMPDYRPKHAFPGLVTLEDIRNGNIHDEDKPKYAFPGLEMYTKRDPDKAAVTEFEGYTAFDGDRESAQNKIEEMKKQFSSQLQALNVDAIMNKVIKEESAENTAEEE